MSLTVLGGGVSPFVRKVRVFLSEKGLDYKHEPINPFSPPEGWRDVSPLGRIPAFRDGDLTLPDSSVICAYLERKFPNPALYPKDDADYAKALWIEEYMDGGVVPAVGPNIFQALVLKPLLSGVEPDEERAQKCIDETLPPLLEYLERSLGDREFFIGDRLSIADIAVASPFASMRLAGVRPDPARWPKLDAFIDRMHSRDSFVPLIEEDKPIFGKRWV